MDPRHDSKGERGLPRREFLKLSALAGGGALLVPRTLRARPAAPAAPRADRILVVLEMGGGNDGLNTIVPFANDAYARARGDLALDRASVLPAGDDVGFHPALDGLKTLFDAGHVAVVEGVGYPEPVRSHFLSMDIWHAADPDGRRRGSGWLGRTVDAVCGDDGDPNLLIALGSRVPFSCDGAEHRAVAFSTPQAYRLIGRASEVRALDSAVSSTDVSDRAREFLRRAYLDARASSDAVRAAVDRHRPAVQYPGTALARDLRTVASLIAGDLGTRVFAVSMGGFDTHSAQRPRQERQLREVGDAVKAFHDDLAAHRLSDRVLLLAFSEFGRRVARNGSGGTDHGTAGPLFLVGDGVKPGFHGRRPVLDRLDANGDLEFTTDFRRVYADVVGRWFSADPARVIDGAFEPLGVVV